MKNTKGGIVLTAVGLSTGLLLTSWLSSCNLLDFQGYCQLGLRSIYPIGIFFIMAGIGMGMILSNVTIKVNAK